MYDYNPYEHVPFEIIEKDKELWANRFADGDKSLYDLLMYCFNNNIPTYKCDSYNDEEGFTFLALYVPLNNEDFIYKLLDAVANIGKIATRIQKSHDHSDTLMFDIRSYYNGSLFDCLYNELSNIDKVKKIPNDIIKIIAALKKLNNCSYDFYVQINNIGDGHKLYRIGADYIHGEKRRLYAIDRRIKPRRFNKIPEYFSPKVLYGKARRIDDLIEKNEKLK